MILQLGRSIQFPTCSRAGRIFSNNLGAGCQTRVRSLCRCRFLGGRNQKKKNPWISGWWFFTTTHLKNMLVKMGSSSPNRGENKKCLKPPPRYSFLETKILTWKWPPFQERINSQDLSIFERGLYYFLGVCVRTPRVDPHRFFCSQVDPFRFRGSLGITLRFRVLSQTPGSTHFGAVPADV